MDKLNIYSIFYYSIPLLIIIYCLYTPFRKEYPPYKKHKYLLKYGIEITGIVMRAYRNTSKFSEGDDEWDAIDVQYEIEGNVYTYTFSFDYTLDEDKKFHAGDKISVFIDPYNHKEASLHDGNWYLGKFIKWLIFAGIILFIFILDYLFL